MNVKYVKCGICGYHRRDDGHCRACGSYYVVRTQGISYYIDVATNRLIGRAGSMRDAIEKVGKTIGA